MYINRNKGFSFLEIIITISISLILSSILFELIFSINKSFIKISDNLKRERNIETFKNLLSSHIEYNKSLEVRVLNISSESAVPNFTDIFKEKNKDKKGKFLILKFEKLIDIKNQTREINYRTFFFVDNKLEISYFLYGDMGTYGTFSSQTELIDNCDGNFELEKNLLKIFIKNLDTKKGKKYEFSLYF